MYSFKDKKFAYLGQRSIIYEDTEDNVIVLYNEGIILRLNWLGMKAYPFVETCSSGISFLAKGDNIYLTEEEPVYYA